MSSPERSSGHVPLKSLWAYRAEKTPLSHDETQHLYRCNECLSLLGLCHVSGSLDEARTRLKEEEER